MVHNIPSFLIHTNQLLYYRLYDLSHQLIHQQQTKPTHPTPYKYYDDPPPYKYYPFPIIRPYFLSMATQRPHAGWASMRLLIIPPGGDYQKDKRHLTSSLETSATRPDHHPTANTTFGGPPILAIPGRPTPSYRPINVHQTAWFTNINTLWWSFSLIITTN